MIEVTTGLARSHARETRAALHSWALAIGAMTSRIFHVRLIHDRKIKAGATGIRGLLFVRLNFPESKPPASGLQTSRPIFSDSIMGTSSRSRSRPAME